MDPEKTGHSVLRLDPSSLKPSASRNDVVDDVTGALHLVDSISLAKRNEQTVQVWG